MKILMVNKFFYIKGGSETYYFALRELLESKGHEVIDFSMKDEKNFPSQYAPILSEAWITIRNRTPSESFVQRQTSSIPWKPDRSLKSWCRRRSRI